MTVFQTQSKMVQRSFIHLFTFWSLVLIIDVCDSTSETLSLSGRCDSSRITDQIFCNRDYSTFLSDITVELDCSEPNQIVVRYPDIHTDERVQIPQELILNCSSDGFQTESLCLLTNFGSVNVTGPYTLNYSDQSVISPVLTCIVTTCFTNDGFNDYYLTPPTSCLIPGRGSPAITPSRTNNLLSSTSAITSIISMTSSHTIIGNSIITRTVATTTIRPTTLPVIDVSSQNISGTEFRIDVNVGDWSLSTVMLPMILTLTLVSSLVIAIPCVICHLQVRRKNKKIFLVYNKCDMVFDPLYTPVDIDTPAAIQHLHKASTSRIDLLEDLDFAHQSSHAVPSKEAQRHINLPIPFLHRMVLDGVHEDQYTSSITREILSDHSDFEKCMESDEEDAHVRITIADIDAELHPLSTLHRDNDSIVQVKVGDSTVFSHINDGGKMAKDGLLLHLPSSFQGSSTDCHSERRLYVKNHWNVNSSEILQTSNQRHLESNKMVLSHSGDVFRLDLTSGNGLASNSRDFIFSFSEESFQNSQLCHVPIVPIIETHKRRSADNLHTLLDFAFGEVSEHTNVLFSGSMPALQFEENCRQPHNSENNNVAIKCGRHSVSPVTVVHAPGTTNSVKRHSLHTTNDATAADSETSICMSGTYDSSSLVSLVSTSEVFSQHEDREECNFKELSTKKEVIQPTDHELIKTDNDTVCCSAVERSHLDSPCSSTESGYYGYQFTPPPSLHLDHVIQKGYS